MPQSVCLVSFDYPPLEGGISRLCAAIVEEMLTQGKSVSVISREVDASKHAFCAPQTTEFRVSPKRGKAEWQLFKRLRKHHRNDLIITGVWYPEALIARLAGCKRLVVLAHGNDVMFGRNSVKNRVLNTLRRWVFGNAQLLIANSHYTGKLVEQQTSTPVAVAPLGVDHKRFQPLTNSDLQSVRERYDVSENDLMLLTTSRVQAYKGHDVVLEALARLPEPLRRQCRYRVAGRGEHLDALKALTQSLGLTDIVTFLGFVEEDDLPALYAAADVFVMCTREQTQDKQVEGFGLVFLEAQSSGTPAIGAMQGGIPDAIEQGNGGFLIQRDDVEALATQLEVFLTDRVQLQQQSDKARKRVIESATWHHYGQRVATILEQHLGKQDVQR